MAQHALPHTTHLADRLLGRPMTILALCFALVTLDGFDAQVMTYVAPKLVTLWRLDRSALAPALSAGLFGLMIGAPLLGYLGDRIGRRRLLLISTAWVAIFSLATALASSIPQLVALRFLTGIGVGGAVPAAIALVSEHAPARQRASFVTITVCGFAVGPAIGGFVAGPLIGAWGWHALFIAGGLLPLALMLPLRAWLPADGDRAGWGDPAPPPRLARIFADGRGVTTVLLWATLFLNLVALNLVLSWLPIVLSDLGFAYAQASTATAMFHIGGVIGGFALGAVVGRFGYRLVCVLALLGAGISVIAIGASGGSIAAVRVSILFAGFFVVGGQVVLNGLSGMLYPAAIRSTGSGWALGVGRVGGAVGPLVGGLLMARRLDQATLFYIEAVPLLIGALLCAWMNRGALRRAAAGWP